MIQGTYWKPHPLTTPPLFRTYGPEWGDVLREQGEVGLSKVQRSCCEEFQFGPASGEVEEMMKEKWGQTVLGVVRDVSHEYRYLHKTRCSL